MVAVVAGLWHIFAVLIANTSLKEALHVCGLAFITMVRVFILIALASLVWVPIGIWVGMRPRAAEIVQPIAQFMAAFPANLLFPLAVYGIVVWKLNPDVFLSPLMILGTQWYILFNIIAGATTIPAEMRYAATNFGIKGWLWWRKVALPAVLPFYVTGAITASGGSWNAAQVSELVSWGHTEIRAKGLGSYIADAAAANDFHRIVLGRRRDELVRRDHQSALLAALVLLRRAQISDDLTEDSMNNSPLLQCTDVRKAFPKPDGEELLVLDGMNLELREGQIMGLLGRSGSGKSTLLRLIAGLAEPSAGEVQYLGNPVVGTGARHRDGVPEFRAVPLAHRVRECGARPRGAKPAARGDPQALAGRHRFDRSRRVRVRLSA